MPPIERLPGLRGISREHHEGLLLCWKVRAGLARNVPPARIRQYCRRFLKHTLKPHFEVEEDVLFPVLGYQDPDVRKAMADPEVLGRVRTLGGDVFGGDPAAFLKAQRALWARVVKERGIQRV
mgnify:CR=1 FL=1